MASQGLVNAKLDERSLQRALDRLAKYEGKPFKTRMEAAFRAGLGLAVAPMRRIAPVGPAHGGKRTRPGGLTKKSISVRKGKPTAGYLLRYGTKPRVPHAHLVSQTHRIVTHKPLKREVGRSQPNPFVEQVISAYEGRIKSFIADAVASEGVTVFGGITDLGGF